MFTDDQSRNNSSGTGGFTRRNITNPRFDGDKTTPSYQSGSDYTPPPPSYGGSSSYNSRPRPQYNSQQRSHGSEGGYNRGSNYGSNNRTGGYQRNTQSRDSGSASSDRVIRQNDQIIKLLREIRDRLPAPPAGTQQYDSSADTPQEPYKAEPSYQAADADGDGAFDISGGPGNGGASAPAAAVADTADEEDKFNS